LARLLNGSFDGDDDADEKIDLIAEIAGATALGHGPRHTRPKAVVLLGRTAENGKSQILDLLRGLVSRARGRHPANRLRRAVRRAWDLRVPLLGAAIGGMTRRPARVGTHGSSVRALRGATFTAASALPRFSIAPLTRRQPRIFYSRRSQHLPPARGNVPFVQSGQWLAAAKNVKKKGTAQCLEPFREQIGLGRGVRWKIGDVTAH
jgi:hypothetical protein